MSRNFCEPYTVEVINNYSEILFTVISSKKDILLDLAKVEHCLNKDHRAFALYYNNATHSQERMLP